MPKRHGGEGIEEYGGRGIWGTAALDKTIIPGQNVIPLTRRESVLGKLQRLLPTFQRLALIQIPLRSLA